MNGYRVTKAMDRGVQAMQGATGHCWAKVREVHGRWQADRDGAAAVQFIIVLPIFVLVVFGLYGLFTVMSARDTLCEATWEASRYLQVEGPHFPLDNPDYDSYPDDWVRVATDIINQELASRTLTQLYPVLATDVLLDPPQLPKKPEDTLEVRDDPVGAVQRSWFTIKVTKAISNPLGALLGSDPGLGTIRLTCQSTGFFEDKPVGPTGAAQPGGGRRCPQPVQRCDTCPGCSPTPWNDRTPTVCPICRN